MTKGDIKKSKFRATLRELKKGTGFDRTEQFQTNLDGVEQDQTGLDKTGED